MENFKKKEKIFANISHISEELKKEGYIEENNSINEKNPISLKSQHFESFLKKIKNDSSKLKNKNNINKEDKVNNENFIKNQNYIANFSVINGISNFQNNNYIKKKFCNLTYYNTEKNLNKMKVYSNLKNGKNINISLKTKFIKEGKIRQNRERNKIQKIDSSNNNAEIKLNKIIQNTTFLSPNNSNKNNLNIYRNKSRNKSNLFMIKHHSQNIEGYLGRKELNGIPFTFESIMVHNNIYSNKSEKKRHEIILDEFIKLRHYIEGQPENKLMFIKDFLNKYHIEYEKYNKEKLLSFCDFLCYHDKNVIICFLKPYLDIKNMVHEILNNIDKINKLLGIEKDAKNNEIKEEVIPKENNYNELYKYSSPCMLENNLYINKRNMENNKIKYYTKESLRQNHRYENNLTENEETLKETKIKLRDLEHQKKLHIPDKNYIFRNDLLIKDMNKEMNILKNKFEQTLYNRSFPIRNKYGSQDNYKNDNNGNEKESKIKNHIIFSQFKDKPKNMKKIEEDIFNNFILSNEKERNNSIKFILMKKENDIENNKKNNLSNLNKKYSMDEIIKRLYYKPMKIKFDINEVIRKNKITEYYALKLAKHNKFLNDINNNSYFLRNNNLKKESEKFILKDK